LLATCSATYVHSDHVDAALADDVAGREVDDDARVGKRRPDAVGAISVSI
jgi:hypothetical protein